MRLYGSSVCFGGVSLVFLPLIVGEVLGNGVHVVVPIGLCKDGSGGNGEVFPVAFDDGCVRNVGVGSEAVAIDEQMFGTDLELVHGAVHGKKGCFQDVDAVDFFGRDDAYCPSEGFLFDDGAQGIPLFLA